MNIVLCSAIVAIFVGSFLCFIEFTTNNFYFSAIIDLFLFDHKKYKLYRKAKKIGVRHYLVDLEWKNDYYNKTIPEFYLYPLTQSGGGIKYYLYTKDYEFITENFHLIRKL